MMSDQSDGIPVRGSVWSTANRYAPDAEGGGVPAVRGGGYSPSTATPPLIAVLDDDTSIVEGLSLLLEGWGFSVLRSHGVGELMSKLETADRAPSLIIADHRLPVGGTGLDAVRRARAFLGHDVPAIILTGDTTPERRAEATAERCRLLFKPVHVAEMRSVVFALVS